MSDKVETIQNTFDYARAHPDLTYEALFPDGPMVSQAGFGTYRVATNVKSHEEALSYALQQGINLIDTSSNYGDGEAERLIGKIVSAAIEKQQFGREAIVVISKAGYIQGTNLEVVQERKREGRPFPNVVQYAQGLEHCIHPDFLADQLTRSLQRLQISYIDGYLLHNPEYYLMWAYKMWADKGRRPLNEAHTVYYQRLRLAFAHLEGEVARGRIRWYGVSSNTFPAPNDDPHFTSLERLWRIAQTISENHHFRGIQLPMNLLEPGAVTELNQTGERSTLAFAHEQQLAVLVNRPLNAMHGESLMRLADADPPTYPATPIEVSTAVDTLVQAELAFQQEILPKLDVSPQMQRPLLEQLAIGRILQGQWRSFGGYRNWLDIHARYLIPRAQNAIHILSNRPNLPPEVAEWLQAYVNRVDIASTAVSAFYQEEEAKLAQTLKKEISHLESDWEADSLSQMAIRALRSTTGVSSVLVGMRRRPYVDDVLAELRRPAEKRPRRSTWDKLQHVL